MAAAADATRSATTLQAQRSPVGAQRPADDVVLLKVAPAAALPDNAEIWRLLLEDLNLVEVATPPDGHCFFSSCYCVKTGVCPKQLMSKPHLARTRKEAAHYRKGCYGTLLDHYDTHVATGLLEEGDLRDRLTGPVEDAELRGRIQAYLETAKTLPTSKAAPTRHWAGEPEIKSTVYWFREPLLVFDKSEAGEIFAWLYHLALTAPVDDIPTQETVTMSRLSLEEAKAWVTRFAEARVAPLMMVLRRVDGTALGNHFNGLRIRAHLYAEWAGSPKKRARMATRRRQLLEDAGLYVPPAWNPAASPPVEQLSTLDSDSTYIPSSAISDPTPAADPTQVQPTGPAGLSLSAMPFPTSSGSPLLGATPVGTPLFAVSLVTPQSPLTDSDYMTLLSSSKLPNALVPQHLERWLRKALRDNQAAYEQWRQLAGTGQGPAADALRAARTIDDACLALLSWPETLIDMLQAVPYVPVVFARNAGLLQQLGQEILILGRTAHLREIVDDASTPPGAVQLASPWLAAVEATVSRTHCWQLANSAARWGRLRRKFKTMAAPPLAPSHVLPPALRAQPVATRCKHLLCWTAEPANAEVARAGVTAFTNGSWIFPSELFQALAVAYTRCRRCRPRLIRRRWPAPPASKGTSVPEPPGSREAGGSARGVDDAGTAEDGNGPSKQERSLPTLLLATQNVRGFSKKKQRTNAWFDGLRARIDGDCMDAIFLQETKATKNWAGTLEARYARGWGIREEKAAAPLSWWTSTKRASGGVAVLLHPDSPLRQLTPCWPELWGPHCLALAGQADGCELTLVCVYAPVDRTAREALFSALSRRHPTGMVILGGDFNCSLDVSLDRSHPSGDSHDSPYLARLLRRWSLVDSATSDMLEAAATGAEVDFHARAHSYWYRLPDGQRASSRLDRWYGSNAHYDSVVGTEVTPPCSHSDHDAVLLRIGRPAHAPREKRQGRRSIRYPPPRYAQEVVAAASATFLAQVSELVSLDPCVSAARWDAMKDDFRVQLLRAVKESARKLRGSYRQRLRRLRAALRAERARAALPRARGSLVQQFALLTVDSAARQESLRAAIVSTQELYAAQRRLRKFEQYSGHHPDATRALFRRVSMKYTGRRSSRSRSSRDSVDPNSLARDWRPILQQECPTQEDRDKFFGRLGATETPVLQLECAAFSPSEVTRTIANCPRGKACGPDGIPNDWYLDHAVDLAPVLAALLSQWMAARVLPQSFATATICCIPKISAPRTGLDYRPIALLNSDYKIYSRLLLNRVKESLASVLSPTQFGFVPGRQVHDAIDVWSAAQRLVHERRLPESTTAVLLDFAKAYDTLDRTFLSAALDRHGFPRALTHAIEDMHLATSAKFLSCGELSDDISIHNGIRQGCPLAPVLFVLAIDLLYQAAERDPELHGVWLDDQTRVTLGGYADDTTAFLAAPDEEAALLRLLDDFSAASGLRVNAAKCAVTAQQRPMRT